MSFDLDSAAARPRPRGFAPWRPRIATRLLLVQVNHVLTEFYEHLPLTARQVFYRLVAAWDYPKDEAAYARLCEALNRARRCGLIPFDAIRDDGVTRLEPDAYAGAADFIARMRSAAESFCLDRQAGQPVRLWLLCEAGGMAPMLARAAHPYGVPVLSSGGFDSVTAKHDLAREIAASLEWHERAEVLHIGDYDPSGVHIFQSLAEDVGEMVEALCGQSLAFTRLAVTPQQIAGWSLPTAPPKPTDRRAFAGETVQAEAIPPDMLAALVREAIEARQDTKSRQDVIATEDAERRRLLASIERLE